MFFLCEILKRQAQKISILLLHDMIQYPFMIIFFIKSEYKIVSVGKQLLWMWTNYLEYILHRLINLMMG